MSGRTLEAWSRRLKPRMLRGGRALPRLWLVSDPVRLPDPREAAARLPRGAAVLARGVRPDALRALARLCRQRGLLLLVGGDGRAALALRAGLHLPDRSAPRSVLPFLRARRGGAPWAMLSLAVHGRAGLARARRLHADAAVVSPAFPTLSHPDARSLGPARWTQLAAAAGRPVVALGGLDGATSGRLPRQGIGMAAALAAVGAMACVAPATLSQRSRDGRRGAMDAPRRPRQ